MVAPTATAPMSAACSTRAEQDLVELVRVGEELVVVDLHDERDLVRVPARHRAQHAQRGGHRVAAALDGELHDVLGVEVGGVLGEGGARGVLDALVHGQDRDVAGAAPAGRGRAAAAGCAARAPAGRRPRARGPRSRGPGRCRRLLRDALAAVLEQRARVGAQQRRSMASMPAPRLHVAVAVLMRSFLLTFSSGARRSSAHLRARGRAARPLPARCRAPRAR